MSARRKYVRRLHSLYAGGLLVIILVLLQGFLGLDRFDCAIYVSIAASAAALPPLALLLVLNFVEEVYPHIPSRSGSVKCVNILFLLGVAAGLASVDAAFWHVSWWLGALFLVIFVVTVIIGSWYIANLEENQTEERNK